MTLREELDANYFELNKMCIGLVRNNFLEDWDEISQDIVHDTILRALTFESSYVEGTNFFNWIYIIMKNVYYQRGRDIISRSKAINNVNGKVVETEDKELQSLPDGIAFEEIIRKTKLVSGKKREVLALYSEGFSYTEIGTLLNIPLGTVKSRMYYGIKELREILEVEAY